MRRYLFARSVRYVILLGTAWLTVFPLSSQSADQLPDAIPSRTADSKTLIQEAATALAREPDQRKRHETASNLIRELNLVPSKDLQPLVALLPESLRPRTLSPLNEKEVAKLREELNNPGARSKTWLERAQLGQLNWVETKETLREGKETKRLGVSPGSTFGTALVHFVRSNYEEVLAFTRAELPSEEVVVAYCRVAKICRSERNEPELAAKLMAAAAEAVPTCQDQRKAATTLLQAGYAKMDRQKALEFVESQWVARYSKPSELYELSQAVSLLASADLDFAIDSADEICQRLKLGPNVLLVGVLHGALYMQGPEVVIQWLRSLPASPRRDAAIRSIAGGLSSYAENRRVDGEPVQAWVNALSSQVATIADPVERWWAMEAISDLAKYHAAVSPASFANERIRLFPQIEPTLSSSQLHQYFGLVSHEKQRTEIERQWEGRTAEGERLAAKDIRGTAVLLRDSTLPPNERGLWFDKLLAAARQFPEPLVRAVMLSGLGMALGRVDPARSLEVHWEELKLARQLGLKPTLHDWLDELGTMNTLATADEALNFTFGGTLENAEEVIKALWDFAHKLEDGDDRYAVLEKLGKVLVWKQDYSRAVGVASIISRPVRQARLLGAIAAAQSSKVRRADREE